MAYRRFLAGGAVTAVPNGTRQRLFARQLSAPGWDVMLCGLGCQAQQGTYMGFVEVIWGGKTILSETFNVASACSAMGLPFIRIPAYGLLEGFLTNSSGLANSLALSVEGYYVPRA